VGASAVSPDSARLFGADPARIDAGSGARVAALRRFQAVAAGGAAVAGLVLVGLGWIWGRSGPLGGFLFYGVAAFLFANAVAAWLFVRRLLERLPVRARLEDRGIALTLTDGSAHVRAWDDRTLGFEVGYWPGAGGRPGEILLSWEMGDRVGPIALSSDGAVNLEAEAIRRGVQRYESAEGVGASRYRSVRFRSVARPPPSTV
jgi:hypothetical protein